MPTMKDIAKAAGVSHGTVSNVLNKTGKVSVDKIRRVEEAARKLGYVPNAQAQQLRQSAANQIAIILPTVAEDTYRGFYMALRQLAQQNGFRTELYETNDIAANEERIISSLPVPSMAAVVGIPCPGVQCSSLYENISCPVIFMNRSLELQKKDCMQIQFDFVQAGKEIGQYIQKQGWRRVAFFSTSGDPADELELYGSLCTFASDADIFIKKFTSDSNLIINHAFQLLTQELPFDGIITIGNLRADAVEAAFRFLGSNADCHLLCIGNAQTFSRVHPKIYELDYGAMAMKTMDALLGCLQKGEKLSGRMLLPAKGFSFAMGRPAVMGKTETLSMLTLESPTTTALEQFSPFLRETTGIDLKITALSYDALHTQIPLLAEHSNYDLIRMDMARLDEFGQKVYLPLEASGVLDALSVQNVIKDTPFSYTCAGGELYALPFDPSVQILLYRKDLFEDAILQREFYETFRETLTVPATMEEWYRAAEFFTHSLHPGSPTLYGTSITGGNAGSAVCDFLPHYLAEGGKLYDEKGTALLDTSIMRSAMKKYCKRQAYAKPGGELWWRDSVRQFADGNTATVLTFSNHAAYIMNNRYTNLMQKTGAIMVPGKYPLLGGGAIGISRHTHKQSACCQFFDWLYHRDVASAIVRLGGASPVRDAYFAYDNYSVFPWLETVGKNFSVGTRGLDGHSVPGFCAQDYEAALGTAVYRMIHNGLAPDQAAALAQSLYEKRHPIGE